MEQFKLKSIEEFDIDFVAMLNEQAESEEEPQVQTETVIPVSDDEESAENNYFKKTATDFNVEPEFVPAPQEEVVKTPRPLIPIGQNSAYSPVGAPAEPISEDDFGDDEDEKPVKEKSGAGALVGRIVAIVLLAATIVVFVLGCFVTVFLDNGGSDIGGFTLNTISADVIDSAGDKILSKGDLVIAKKVEPNEYTSGSMIAVPSAFEEGRCDVHIVNSINSYYSENAEISTTDITSSQSYIATVMASESFGVVNSYIPVLGGLLHFAMDNIILVCVLFVLLAALWCLILVLIENKKPKKN
ncbi:MAG: hypothetical protein U0M02_12690 [Acutalibacteraceae bacterium]|nr:hypothetical protein [Acutalibacteraceae bacterium]